MTVARPKLDSNLTLERELERVRQKIQDDLLPHVTIDVHRLGKRRAIHDQFEPGPFHRRSEHAGEFRGEWRQVRWFITRIHPSRLDAGEIQQRVHEAEQS